MKRTAIAMTLCILSLAPLTSADTLVMRDGTRVEGTVVGIAARTITFRHVDGTTRRYTTTQVDRLEFLSAERANPRAVKAHTLEAAAGTELVVRTVEMIDSRNRGADQSFSAILERDVMDAAGVVIVPQGSSVQLLIRQVSLDGEIGNPEMLLDLQSITIDGRRYLVNAAAETPDSGTGTGRHRRTAEASSSSAAGVNVQTRGRDVHVPAETVLTFRLDSDVTLQAR